MTRELSEFLLEVAEVRRLHEEGSHEAAHSLVTELVESCPFSPDLLVKKAKLMQLLDRGDELESEISLDTVYQLLQAANAVSPSAIEPVLELGYFAYAVNNDSDEGLIHFERARQLAEVALHSAVVGKVQCLLEIGDFEMALDQLAAAEACFGPDVELLDLRAELEERLSSGS